MNRFFRRLRLVAVSIALLVVAAVVWVGAVEHWVGRQLRALASAYLVPTFVFDDLSYHFPRGVTLRGVRLTSPDPVAPDEAIEILAMDSLRLVLSEIPRPNAPFRMRQLDLAHPTVRLVRLPGGGAPGNLLGFSQLLKKESEATARLAVPAAKLSELLQVRVVSIAGGRIEYDPRDRSAAIMLVDGITAKLLLQPEDAGAYDVEFSLDHQPVLALALRGRLLADHRRLEVDHLSASLQLAQERYHYLTPPMQKLLAQRDITGKLTLDATGMFDYGDAASSRLKAHLELSGAGYAEGDYGLVLDRVDCRISAAGRNVTIEEFAIDALGGHAKIDGSFELDDSLTGALSFEGTQLEIGDLLRGTADPHGVPLFSGLLDFAGTLRGPFADIARHAEGKGQLSLRKARLARLPVLETVDEALDESAEEAMKKETAGHDELSLRFSLEGDRAHIAKLRMNSRWYGLRGHGDAYFDSRLDMAVDGGPLQRIENELGALGDVLGEITETIVRARVTGTLSEPKVGIEVLRLPVGL